MEDNKYAQYILEKELAQKLRLSNTTERKHAYKALYGELFSKFPNIAYNPKSDMSHKIGWQIELLKPFLQSNLVFVEVGAGNCLLSIEIAKYVKDVIAYEVAETAPHIENAPNNLHLKIFDGIQFSEPDNSIDIIYSNQVFEHLHPDDTPDHLAQCYNMLTPGGRLIIITPNGLTGPYDISRHYSMTPEGLHLKEYNYAELKQQLISIGFKKPKFFIGSKKTGYYCLNAGVVLFLESFYKKIPISIRYKLKGFSLLKNVFGIKIMVSK
ncbi:class I SAM-dependent methyltransferase [Flavitalea sp.]|nr:class I SAM-dependent methyltransferase [Flavitalea sp.]